MGLATLDWVVVGGYFLIVIAIAVWAILRERRGEETSADYFLAGRNIGWFVVGASLFASNIGSEHLVGLAGTGASDGLVMGQLELQASLILLLLGWLFVPFYVKSGVFTMPELLERRYSPAARWYLAVVAVIGYVLTKISVTIYAGGVVFESLMGVDFWTGALVVVAVTGIYTVLGGLRAVVYTDLMQAFVLLLGAGVVTVIGLAKLGGWGAMVEIAEPGFFNIWKSASHPEFPWTGMAFGAPIIAIWYWCTDQFIVQRTLSARGIDDARRGTILAAFLKQLPLFIFVVPGVIAYCLAKNGEIELDSPDKALPTLVAALLPVGLKGLVAAGLLAALMSSLSSVLNSCSTLITLDIYKKLKPQASERHLVVVGQSATAVLVLFGLALVTAFGMTVASRILNPRRPTPQKEMPYESGMIPLGDTRARFSVKFYMVAISFIVFDIETIFLIPWAVQMRELGWGPFVAVFLFVGVLAAGLAYEWKKGGLEWD